MKRRLVVIDGKSVFYRGYYAMPHLSTRDGIPTGGVYGFTRLALEVVKQLQPDYVYVAWDKKGTSIRRRLALLPTYKAGRTRPPQDFFDQIPMLREVIAALGWPLLEADDYEADDIMGTLAHQAEAQGVETCLISSDLDMLQLVSPQTHMYAMKKGFAQIEQYNPETFTAKYGLRVAQFLDFKALKGDSSDNIPGVPGIGEKTATALLQQWGSLEAIYDHVHELKPGVAKKLQDGRELALLSRQVAEIMRDAPVQFNPNERATSDGQRLRDTLEKYDFQSLMTQLPPELKQAVDAASNAQIMVLDQPKEITETAWQVNDVATGELVAAAIEGGMLHLARADGRYMKHSVADVPAEDWAALSRGRVSAYDVKELYHALSRELAGSNLAAFIALPHFSHVHDVRLASFLLEPLRRDTSVAALVGHPGEELDASQQVLYLQRTAAAQQQALVDDPKLQYIAERLDFPLIWSLFQMERAGIAVDKTVLSAMDGQLASELAALEAEAYRLVGYEFNLGSPRQLSEVLFTKLQLPTTGIKKGKTGYSTGKKELDKLAGRHPIIQIIEQWRELAKLQHTYVQALPKMVAADGRIHTTFHQDVVSTGRLSSSNPNLQNIPIRSARGRAIRTAFVPGPGRVFVSADYSQFELRLAAELAGDQALIDDFAAGVDIHSRAASEVYGVPIDQVSTEQRRAAKTINFGVLYGMSPHGLAAATNMSVAEAKKFIDHYFALRAPIRQFIDCTLEKARTAGYVETLFGRRRPTPEVNARNFAVRAAAERAAANMPIQGTEADIMKRAMLAVDAALPVGAQSILQIHDSIMVECSKDQAEAVGELLRTTMEQIAPELRVPLKVDISIGDNWGQA